MPRRQDARALLFERIRTSPPKFVHVTGVPYSAEVEPVSDPSREDHVWITLEVPPSGRLRAVVNTVSRLNRDIGADSRIRIGIVKSTWTGKPAASLIEVPGFDYREIESSHNVFYEHYEHSFAVEQLVGKAKRAIRAEVWGELYARDHLGIHQIHSRRASCAVAQDVVGRDGALKFYYAEDHAAELLLFKFCGQP